MQGVVTGGWGFVIAAYSITGIALFGYAAWLIQKNRERR